MEISRLYEVTFVELGVDKERASFPSRSAPTISPRQIAQIVTSITTREMFQRIPEVNRFLWGGAFWTSGHCANILGQQGNENTIEEYVRDQGRENEYQRWQRPQLSLF
jgi:hypothetical protein